MKQILLSLAFFAILGAQGQTDTCRHDMGSIITFGMAYISVSPTDIPLSFSMNGPGLKLENIYDSGRIEINGDTLMVIRMLAKMLDSTRRRYYDCQPYVQDIISAAIDLDKHHPSPRAVMVGNQTKIVNGSFASYEKSIDAFAEAVGKYRSFVYGKPKKKGGKK